MGAFGLGSEFCSDRLGLLFHLRREVIGSVPPAESQSIQRQLGVHIAKPNWIPCKKL